MGDQPRIVTGLGKAELHRILVRGRDLTEDLVGKITFSQMAYLMLAGRMPTAGETRMVDALLTILVEHGMVSSVISARGTCGMRTGGSGSSTTGSRSGNEGDHSSTIAAAMSPIA